MDSDYEQIVERRLSNGDVEAIFTSGECHRFALRLHDRCGYEIRGVRSKCDSSQWGHVWARMGDKGIDIHGVYPERLLAALANGGELGQTIEDVSPDEIRELIRMKSYPEELSRRLDDLADHVFKAHERFLNAKPIDPDASARFGENLKTLLDDSLDQRV